MSIEEMQAIYTTLKAEGDLKKLFPNMTGEWDKDKKAFTTAYQNNEKLLEDPLSLDDDEDFCEPFDNFF